MGRCAKEEKIRRIRVIQEYLIDGHNTADILQTIMTNYDIGLRSAQMYLKKAREMFIEWNKQSIQERYHWHLASRERLIKKWGDRNPNLALAILRDLAELEGHYQKQSDKNADDVKETCEMVLPGGHVLKI